MDSNGSNNKGDAAADDAHPPPDTHHTADTDDSDISISAALS